MEAGAVGSPMLEDGGEARDEGCDVLIGASSERARDAAHER